MDYFTPNYKFSCCDICIPRWIFHDIEQTKIRGGYRLLVPYLIWSFVYIIKDILFGGISLKYLVYALLCGKTATPFYYIIVMLQLTIMTPCLIKNRKNWMYLVTPVYLILIYSYNIFIGSMPPLYETVFPAWFFFYILGMDCRNGKFDWIIKKMNWMWVITALILSIAEAYGLRALGCADGFVITQIKFSSFLYSTTLCLWLQKKKCNVDSNMLTVIGDYSYGIFYCHILVLWVVKKTLQLIGLDSRWIIYFGLSFFMTAVGSIVTVWLVRHILNKLKCEKIIALIGF